MATETIFSHYLAVLHFCQHHLVRHKKKIIYDGHVQNVYFYLLVSNTDERKQKCSTLFKDKKCCV